MKSGRSILQRAGAILIGALALAVPSSNASASSLFSEDFESYAAGSDLLGQGGWFGSGGPMLVGAGGPLPTRILDGLAAAASATQHFAAHTVAAPAAGLVTVMEFDALAATGSANSWAGLSSDASGSLNAAVIWDLNGGHWQLEIRQPGLPALAFSTALGPNVPTHLRIYFDRSANEVWGSYLLGAIPNATTRFAFSPSSFDQLDTVNISFDYRGTKGIQLDNLSVSAVPEPETCAMLLAGLALVGIAARRRERATAAA